MNGNFLKMKCSSSIFEPPVELCRSPDGGKYCPTMFNIKYLLFPSSLFFFSFLFTYIFLFIYLSIHLSSIYQSIRYLFRLYHLCLLLCKEIYFKELASVTVWLASPGSSGQDSRLETQVASGWCCSLEAESLLCLETSAFVLETSNGLGEATHLHGGHLL